MAPTTTDRVQHRAATRDLRGNAGIDLREDVEAVADFGAAARRLRASVKGDDQALAPVSRADASAIDLDLRKSALAGRATQLLANLENEKRSDDETARSLHPSNGERRFARGLRLAR